MRGISPPPLFFKCTLSFSSTIYLPFLFLWSPGQKIQQSEIQTPSKEDMYLKYHMANKTYFTTYLTFNKQIDQCKQKLTQNPFIKAKKTPTLNYSYLNSHTITRKILRF